MLRIPNSCCTRPSQKPSHTVWVPGQSVGTIYSPIKFHRGVKITQQIISFYPEISRLLFYFRILEVDHYAYKDIYELVKSLTDAQVSNRCCFISSLKDASVKVFFSNNLCTTPSFYQIMKVLLKKYFNYSLEV